MSLQASETFRLVSRVGNATETSDLGQKVLSDWPQLFKGLGCMNKPYKMVLKGDSQPVIKPARRVPPMLKEPLKRELGRTEAAGIVARMNEPSDWVSPQVIVRKKDGKIRVCIDPRHINECLKREHYQMPKREHIEADLKNATVFSRLDVTSGFHEILLDDETSKICTLRKPSGRYRYKRLPFGLATAPEVSQKTFRRFLKTCMVSKCTSMTSSFGELPKLSMRHDSMQLYRLPFGQDSP